MTSTEAPFSVAQTPGDFTEFYATNRDHIGRMLALTLNDTALGFEAVDEAMTRAYQRWSTINQESDGHANPQGWVYRVGLNWARSWQRRLSTAGKKQPAVVRQEQLRSEQRSAAMLPTTHDVELEAALAALPLHQRSVVVMRYLLDWSNDDIARALDISSGTVKSRLHRALATLRSDLDGNPADDDRRRRATSPIALLPLDERLGHHLTRTAEAIDAPVPPGAPSLTSARQPRSGPARLGLLVIAAALLLLVALAGGRGGDTTGFSLFDSVSNLAPNALGGSSELPIAEQAVWDGTQFVINDNSAVDDDHVYHWTSPNGIKWTRHDGPHMAGWERRCYPGFPCNIEPEEVVDIPYHFGRSAQSVEAIRDDAEGGIALVTAWTQYTPFLEAVDEDGEQYPGPGTIHPELAKAAADHSDCFAQAIASGPSFTGGIDEPSITSWGTAGSAEWSIALGCELNRQSENFTLTLNDKLTDQQLHWLAAGGKRQLFAVRRDGQIKPVVDPPVTTFWSDGIVGGDLVTSISEITATASRFWAVNQGVLVSSVDGLEWSSANVGLDGRQAAQVVAGLAGDVAVLVVDDHRLSGQGDRYVVLSHDDGVSWSKPIAIGGGDDGYMRLRGVSSAGVVYHVSTSDDFVTRVASDRPPISELDLEFDLEPLALGAALGDEHLIVPDELRDVNGNPTYEGWMLKVYDTSGRLVGTVSE